MNCESEKLEGESNGKTFQYTSQTLRVTLHIKIARKKGTKKKRNNPYTRKLFY